MVGAPGGERRDRPESDDEAHRRTPRRERARAKAWTYLVLFGSDDAADGSGPEEADEADDGDRTGRVNG